MWEAVTTAVVFVILVLNIYIFSEYIRFKRIISKFSAAVVRNMDCDDVIDQLLSLDSKTGSKADAKSTATKIDSQALGAERERLEQKRARLAAIVAGGTAEKYLGKSGLTLSKVDEMTDAEVSKHYGRYEARLGASMTKTLGATALQVYAMIAGTFLPIPPENLPKLTSDLEEDPFVGHALTTACCELYYRYGMYLAPLTAAMTTAKHCRVEAQGFPKNMCAESETERETSPAQAQEDGCSGSSSESTAD